MMNFVLRVQPFAISIAPRAHDIAFYKQMTPV